MPFDQDKCSEWRALFLNFGNAVTIKISGFASQKSIFCGKTFNKLNICSGSKSKFRNIVVKRKVI